MRLALVSLDQCWLDKETNFARCAEFVRVAAKQGCGLVIFPEMTLTGYSLDMPSIAESAGDSLTMRRFLELAHDVAVDIIFGACLRDSISDNPQNTLCLARREGEVSVVYSKIHPFSFVGEDKVLQAGSTLGFVNVTGLRLGCSICYDLRFPEMFSAMTPHCDAIVNIANWPVHRVAHWRTLLLARAIENQLFVFGVNRIGTDGNGLRYEKCTMAVAPDGTVLTPTIITDEIDIYDIEPTDASRYRTEFPTVRDKRYFLYWELFGNNVC